MYERKELWREVIEQEKCNFQRAEEKRKTCGGLPEENGITCKRSLEETEITAWDRERRQWYRERLLKEVGITCERSREGKGIMCERSWKEKRITCERPREVKGIILWEIVWGIKNVWEIVRGEKDNEWEIKREEKRISCQRSWEESDNV